MQLQEVNLHAQLNFLVPSKLVASRAQACCKALFLLGKWARRHYSITSPQWKVASCTSVVQASSSAAVWGRTHVLEHKPKTSPALARPVMSTLFARQSIDLWFVFDMKYKLSFSRFHLGMICCCFGCWMIRASLTVGVMELSQSLFTLPTVIVDSCGCNFDFGNVIGVYGQLKRANSLHTNALMTIVTQVRIYTLLYIPINPDMFDLLLSPVSQRLAINRTMDINRSSRRSCRTCD